MMRGMEWRARLPWAVAAIGAVAAVAYAASLPAAVRELEAVDAPGLAELGLTARGYALYVVVLVSVLALVHLTVAMLLLRLARRRTAAVSSALVLICLGVVFPQTLPALAAAHPGWAVVVDLLERGTVVALTVWVLTFPDGRFRPRWSIAVAGVVAVVEVAGLLGVEPPGALLFDVLWALLLVAVVVVRYRMAGEDRAGIRWVAGGTAAALAGLVLAAVAQELGARPGTVADLLVQAGIVLAFLLIPVSVAVALLRHGIWGVEASVGRAVTYGVLTVGATGLYATVVAVATAVLPLDPTATATVAASLLAVAVHPAYVRLRRAVDGLLYGDRRRAAAGLASLGERTADADGVLASVAEILLRTLRLPYVAVTVGTADDVVARGSAGSPAEGWPTDAMDLTHLGSPVGTLVLARRDRDGPVAEIDRRAVADVVQQLSVLGSSVLLTEQLRRSRRGLVTAQEEERRRLRNDLHDGLGPALSAVLLTLSAAENRLPSDPSSVPALLADARGQTAAAVAEVRRLVYGLRPPALDELGLDGALRSVLTRLGSDGVSFRLETSGPLDDLPAAVEVAAYRIVSEAATNVVRHAYARSCSVSVERRDDVLEVAVADDGAGVQGAAGVGMASMRERATELGGALSVESGSGRGTVVRTVLPLVAAERAEVVARG
jgi:signal transduction histidine kinase